LILAHYPPYFIALTLHPQPRTLPSTESSDTRAPWRKWVDACSKAIGSAAILAPPSFTHGTHTLTGPHQLPLTNEMVMEVTYQV
jgi:hypothetical protein